MPLQDAPHDILVNFDAKGIRNLLGDFQATELRIATLHLDYGGNELRGGAFGPRLWPALAGIEQSIFAADQRLVKAYEGRRSGVSAQSKPLLAAAATTE